MDTEYYSPRVELALRKAKAMLAAGITGLVATMLAVFFMDSSSDEVDTLLFFGWGAVYGIATAPFLFTSLGDRFKWIVLSVVSYFFSGLTAVGGLGSGPDGFGMSDHTFVMGFIMAGMVGAFILAAGYSMFRKLDTKFVFKVSLVGALAGFVGVVVPQFNGAEVWLVWPLWQLTVTWFFVKNLQESLK
jgi:hypothetical protein